MASYQGRHIPNSPNQKSTRSAPSGARRKKSRPARYPGLLFALWIALALPELCLHLATAQGFSTAINSGLLLPLLFAAVPALLVWALLLFVPNRKANNIIVIVYCFIAYLLCASQLIYYKVFGCFYSAYSMANGGQVLQFWGTVLLKIYENFLLLVFMALPLIILGFWGRKIFSYRAIRPKLMCVPPVLCAIILQLFLVLILPVFGGTATMSAYDLYHNNIDPYYSLNRLGMMTSFRLDVTRLVSGWEPNTNIELDNPLNPLPSPSGDPDSTGTTDTTDTTDATTGTTAPTLDTSPNVLDIDFDSLIAQSDDKKLTAVHQYFQSRTPSNKNEYTGMFEGKNLILITAEAFSYLAVSEERTPTLYKLINEGINFTNYYVPDWGTSTTDGEYAFLTGTVPKPSVWSFSKSSDNSMPLTMAQQLIGLGYNAYAYHGHTYTYYDRNEYLENLGYIYRAYGQNLDVKKTWPESDIEVVDLTTADYVNNEPFTAYYMTISGHREFNFTGNYIAYKNRELVADEPYSTNVRAYLACQLELEYSLELLLERLEEAGVLENTVIVLTADHYPNGLTLEEMSELAGHDIESNFEIFKNACVIYTPGMEKIVVDEPCSHLDLLPTLSNLFGLDFDSRLYMGRDVFSDAPAFVMFRSRSWITEYASYNYSTGEVKNLTETPVTDEYVKQISSELNNRFTVSTRILDYDYWSILFDE